MAKLFGREYRKSELLGKVGDISQLCGIKQMELQGGRSKGVEIARIWTGSGLEFDVNLSRGMGIGAFRYKGMPLGWISPTGDVNPAYYEARGGGMDRSYAGGLMHNSGLRQVGAPCEDEGEELGLHGRIANLPADNVCADGYWEGEDYIISLSGKVREVSALGENLILRRKVTTKLGSCEVLLEDSVENAGPIASPHMILYHTNFGFPLIDGGTRLVIPSGKVVDAADGKIAEESAYGVYKEPTADAGAQIYFHQTSEREGWSGYAVVNDALKLGILVRYEKKNLPELINWVDLETGRYVVEVGPSNCKCFGRKSEREAGTLQFLAPGEIRGYRVSFKVLEGSDELKEAEEEFRSY
ncbi:MAG: aldose 1-epimerase family protein [Clostridiales bacterium]|nr:aldose 1-epimerase family protein [Clostridiales bacterium]